MDWLSGMNAVLRHIEDNLTEEISLEGLARIVGCSVYEFSRIFSFMAGLSVSEYVRRRRLSQAVFDIQSGTGKIIDIAHKYRYESPTAFSRAFKEMHGSAPLSARKSGVSLKNYPPMSFVLQIKGTQPLNFRVERREAFKIVGQTGFLAVEDNTLASLWNAKLEHPLAEPEPPTLLDGLEKLQNLQDGVSFEMTEITDTKTNIHVGWSIEENLPPMHLTVAIDYQSADGKVKAVLGMALDEIKEVYEHQKRIDDFEAELRILEGDDITPFDEEKFEPIPAAEWAVFTFGNERNEENVAQAYAEILTQWFPGSGCTRRKDMPHLEKFSWMDNASAWEIWMPLDKA